MPWHVNSPLFLACSEAKTWSGIVSAHLLLYVHMGGMGRVHIIDGESWHGGSTNLNTYWNSCCYQGIDQSNRDCEIPNFVSDNTEIIESTSNQIGSVKIKLSRLAFSPFMRFKSDILFKGMRYLITPTNSCCSIMLRFNMPLQPDTMLSMIVFLERLVNACGFDS